MLAPALLLTLATGAAAQGFPTKPIKLVLPYSPGGIIDYVGRQIAQHYDAVARETGRREIELRGGGHPYLEAAGGAGTHFYFVHSYHAVPADPSLLVATAQHGPFAVTAAVARGNVFASQFHPEKSQAAGLAVLAAFLRS